MSNTQLTTNQSDLELSVDDLSNVNGGGPVAVASWIALNALTGGIPAMIDLANGSPHLTELQNTKY